jgi:hypothetical protein
LVAEPPNEMFLFLDMLYNLHSSIAKICWRREVYIFHAIFAKTIFFLKIQNGGIKKWTFFKGNSHYSLILALLTSLLISPTQIQSASLLTAHFEWSSSDENEISKFFTEISLTLNTLSEKNEITLHNPA